MAAAWSFVLPLAFVVPRLRWFRLPLSLVFSRSVLVLVVLRVRRFRFCYLIVRVWWSRGCGGFVGLSLCGSRSVLVFCRSAVLFALVAN